METPVTLVSCLFWLARTKWQHSGFPPNYDRYASWSENFLSLDANIVIFTDDHYIESVKEKRIKYDPDFTKTVIIKKNLKDLEFYQKYFFKMSVLMSSPQFKHIKHADCADNMYPLYNVVQYNKISLMREVRDANPFGSTHLMWMDCGSCREGLDKYKNRKFPINTDLLIDKAIHFTHNLEFSLCERKQDYFLSQIRNIQGTSWILPVELVDVYHQLISHELESTMDDGYIGSDEKTYDSIYQGNKDIIHLVKCNWFQFFDVMSQEPVKTVNDEDVGDDNNILPPTVENQDVIHETCSEASEVPSEPVVESNENCSEVSDVVLKPLAHEDVSCDSEQSICGTASLALAAQNHTFSPKKSWWRRLVGG